MPSVNHTTSNKTLIKPRHNSWPMSKSTKGVLIAIPSCLVYITLKATACALSIFGNWGHKQCKNLNYKAKKFEAVHITHNISYCAVSPLPMLLFSKNIARRDVITKEQDILAANKLRTRCLTEQSQNIDSISLETLQKGKFKGAIVDGICYGASIHFIKVLLDADIQSEEQLIATVKQFEEGFPAEAAALQMLHQKMNSLSLKKKIDLQEKQLNAIKRWSPNAMQKIQNIKNNVTELRNKLNQINAVDCLLLRRRLIAALAGLKNEGMDQYLMGFLKDDHQSHNDFAVLSNGYYNIQYKTNNGGHSIVYIKLNFGSYIFDPNFGLSKCSANPSQDLKKLLIKYQNKGSFFLYRFNKI